MNVIPHEDIERNELIAIRLEKIPIEKRNIITEDMFWMNKKLREAWVKIEELSKR